MVGLSTIRNVRRVEETSAGLGCALDSPHLRAQENGATAGLRKFELDRKSGETLRMGLGVDGRDSRRGKEKKKYISNEDPENTETHTFTCQSRYPKMGWEMTFEYPCSFAMVRDEGPDGIVGQGRRSAWWYRQMALDEGGAEEFGRELTRGVREGGRIFGGTSRAINGREWLPVRQEDLAASGALRLDDGASAVKWVSLSGQTCAAPQSYLARVSRPSRRKVEMAPCRRARELGARLMSSSLRRHYRTQWTTGCMPPARVFAKSDGRGRRRRRVAAHARRQRSGDAWQSPVSASSKALRALAARSVCGGRCVRKLETRTVAGVHCKRRRGRSQIVSEQWRATSLLARWAVGVGKSAPRAHRQRGGALHCVRRDTRNCVRWTQAAGEREHVCVAAIPPRSEVTCPLRTRWCTRVVYVHERQRARGTTARRRRTQEAGERASSAGLTGPSSFNPTFVRCTVSQLLRVSSLKIKSCAPGPARTGQRGEVKSLGGRTDGVLPGSGCLPESSQRKFGPGGGEGEDSTTCARRRPIATPPSCDFASGNAVAFNVTRWARRSCRSLVVSNFRTRGNTEEMLRK
ncbi:hypothetical protein K438DRAFT_2133421 [Mycena galopus ATCC 62051]|nr:hypothetical protein K438DRAFT_2133421 [Mycena galopus ATCC 62051]